MARRPDDQGRHRGQPGHAHRRRGAAAKLFRRLVDYLSINNGDVSLAGLPAYLATRDDRLVVASTGQFTGFDNVLDIDGQTVRSTRPPEDLVFIEG